MNESAIICPRCGSNNVTFQMVSIHKNRGCIISMIIFFIKLVLFIFSFVLWLISLLIPKNHKTKVKKYAVCQSCGYSWNFKN